ncbi:diacylglycerol kinase family protein [Aquibacillus koreensis]|nr:diacylglycerol kinase family protein [Aquibacillus koreensis]MCT2537596.1 diacylglycerol kinase family protein [Aquibacillus koreensis]
MSLDFQEFNKRRIAFSCALNGIRQALKSEMNLKIHVSVAFIVIIMAYAFRVSLLEWVVLFLTIGSVIAFELMNTAIEKAMDFLAPDFHPSVGLVKDIAAGAVFIAVLTSVVIGCIIFIPKIIHYFW